MKSKMKLAFLGLSDYGLRYFKCLINNKNFDIVFATTKSKESTHADSLYEEYKKICIDKNIKLFKNGIYAGEFSNHELNGSGIFSTKRGYLYNGEWEEGIKTGQGIEKFKKGLTYEGGFSQNQRNGHGKAMFPGTKFMKDIQYAGNWEGGIAHGQGELS